MPGQKMPQKKISQEKIDRAQLQQTLAAPSRSGIRSIWGDYPSRGLTPERLSRLLMDADQGDATAYLALAEELEEKDAHYAAIISTRKQAVAGLDIHVDPATNSTRDREIAAAVHAVFARQEFQDELIDLLDAIAKGYSVTEIIWSTRGPLWQPAQIVWRDPRWFVWDQETQTRLLLRSEDGDNENGALPLQPGKFICHIAKAKSGLAIRSGLARAAAWLCLFRSYATKDWMISLERFAMPLRVGHYPPATSEADKQTLWRAVANIGTDAAALIPEGMKIEFINANSTKSNDAYERFLRWSEAQLSKLVLGQTETTDAHAGGYATASIHDRVRTDIRDADAKQLAATLNRDLVAPFVAVNFGITDAASTPRARLALPPSGDVRSFVQALAPMIDRGLEVSSADVLTRLGIAEPEKGASLLHPQKQADQAQADPVRLKPAGTDNGAEPSLSANNKQAILAAIIDDPDAPDAIDGLIADELADWEPLLNPLLDPVWADPQKLPEDNDKLIQYRAQLANQMDNMNTDKITDLLAQSRFATRLSGEVGARIDDDEDDEDDEDGAKDGDTI